MTAAERVVDLLRERDCRPVRSGAGWQSRCPAHDDRAPSLSITPGEDRVLLHDHAGCTAEDVVAALQLTVADLFDGPKSSDRPRVVAEYEYTDERGELLFVVERRTPKDFRQRRPDGRGGWTWKLGDVHRVLYRLPEVLAAVAAGQTVYVCEGEADCDRLAAAGVTATCNPGGAGKWRDSYSETLAGADVVVIADRDEPGRKHAAAVAASLTGTAASVTVVEAAAGKDVSDHLAAGHALADLVRVDLDEGAGVVPADDQGGVPDDDQERPRRSQASRLVELALERFRLLLGDDSRPYAVAVEGSNVALPLRGRGGLRERLAKLYSDRNGTVPSASALADALVVLEGHSRFGDPEPVALRLARHGDAIVLDLGTADGRCIVVDPSGWRAEAVSPVLFRRTALTSPLPDPLRGGTLDRLRELLNVDDAGWQLLVGWTVAALIPELPHPILALLGEQGTAKSTTARLLVELIDPSPAPLRSCPRDIRQWAVTAAASWTVALDNVSSVPPWLSDTLCRAVTGDGIVDRALYTDDDVSVLSFRRVVAMTSIDAGALAGDLAERLLPVELARIPAGARRSDADLAAAFNDDRPLLLGALLDLLAQVLNALPGVRLAELPRMADFAGVLAALDSVLGWDSLKAYEQATHDVAENVVESDPFAEAVRTLAGDGWTGTASELLDRLMPERPPRGWPRSARAVAGALRRLVPALRSTGVEVSFERVTGGNRTRTISLARRDGGDANDTPTSVQVIGEDDQSDDTTEEGRDLPSRPSRPSPFAPDLQKRRDDRRDANPDRDANPLPIRDGRDAKDGRDGDSHSTSSPAPRLCLGCGRPLPADAPPEVVAHAEPYCLDRLPAWAS